MPATKTTFLLKDINVEDLARRYDFPMETVEVHELEIPSDVTELSVEPTVEYHDLSRRTQTAVVTFVDYIGNFLPEQTDIFCEWCRHPFDTVPLGVPVKYIPSEAIKRYKSDTITRLTVEPITETRRRELRDDYGVISLFTQNPNDFSHNTLLLKNGYYMCDCMVCSPQCMLAVINDRKGDPLFSRSRMYANRIIRDLYGQNADIKPAGSYRLLKPYGGPLDITEFRENFSRVLYTDLRNPVMEHPSLKMFGCLHRREVRF